MTDAVLIFEEETSAGARARGADVAHLWEVECFDVKLTKQIIHTSESKPYEFPAG